MTSAGAELADESARFGDGRPSVRESRPDTVTS